MPRREADSLTQLVPPAVLGIARTVLDATIPMMLWWGGRWQQLHNDTFADAIGLPDLPLGCPADEAWPAGWSVLGARARAVGTDGGQCVLHDVAIPADDGVPRYWCVQFSPMVAAGGAIVGVLAVLLDRTEQVLAREAERRAADETNANLQSALASNRRIGTAVGILMAHRRITDSSAFELLRLVSQSTHRKLREIAEDVILTGTLPGE